ncbi:hypothetical protein BIW11_12877, partial [Tropilaelaps mercedesae]
MKYVVRNSRRRQVEAKQPSATGQSPFEPIKRNHTTERPARVSRNDSSNRISCPRNRNLPHGGWLRSMLPSLQNNTGRRDSFARRALLLSPGALTRCGHPDNA